MIVNTDITIYNRKANPGTKRMDYCRTVIKGVHWYTDQKVTVAEDGLKSADAYKIRIPMDNREDNYLDPENYAALPWGEHKKYWTLENGDLFIKGAVTFEITRPSELQSLHKPCGRVQSYSDNRFGGLPHIRIGGA